MFSRRFIASVAVGGAALVLLGAAPASAQKMTMSSGAPGGIWYGISAGLSKLLSDNGVPFTAEQGQGNSNIINVAAKKVEVGFSYATVLHHAKSGTAVFKKPITNTRALSSLFEQAQHTLVTLKSGVTGFQGLKGQRFASHTLASSARLMFLDVLKVHGLINLEDELNVVVRGNPATGAKAVKDRQAIGMHGAWFPPAGAITEVTISLPSRLLPISDDKYKELLKLNAGYNRAVIPGGVYKGIDKDVPTISSSTMIITNDAMSDDTAYKIVKILATNIDKVKSINAGAFKGFSPKFMASATVIPYHPGAAKYYREVGALK